MDCSGLVLVEITGIPFELLGFEEDGRGVVKGLGVTRDAGWESESVTACSSNLSYCAAPSIGLMKLHRVGRLDERKKVAGTPWTGDRPSFHVPPSVHRSVSSTRLRPSNSSPNTKSARVAWNQYCCGANAAGGLSVHPSVLGLHRRHPTSILDEGMVKIK